MKHSRCKNSINKFLVLGLILACMFAIMACGRDEKNDNDPANMVERDNYPETDSILDDAGDALNDIVDDAGDVINNVVNDASDGVSNFTNNVMSRESSER